MLRVAFIGASTGVAYFGMREYAKQGGEIPEPLKGLFNKDIMPALKLKKEDALAAFDKLDALDGKIDGNIDVSQILLDAMADTHKATKKVSDAVVKEVGEQAAKHSATLIPALESKLLDIFDTLDTNKDGSIDKKELSEIATSTGLPDVVIQTIVKEVIAGADANKDGSIDRQEWNTVVKSTMKNYGIKVDEKAAKAKGGLW